MYLRIICLILSISHMINGWERKKYNNGDYTDRIVIQTTRTDNPANWFNAEYPHLEYLQNITIGGKRYISAAIRQSRTKLVMSKQFEDPDIELLRTQKEVIWVGQEKAHIRVPRVVDPRWTDQWNLNEDVQPSMKVGSVWAKGYTGTGIVIAVLDDGVETNHPDLSANCDTTRDIDIYGFDNDPNPPSGASHGTEVSGIIAAVKDNGICIAGIAYSGSIIGVRILGNFAISDSEEAQALSHQSSVVDIYCNSWGPSDKTGFEEPGALTKAALADGVATGRAAKGAIYVWASGNGETSDNCNGDGYVNSIYTIAVTSVQSGQNAWYSEVCSAALTAAYGGSEDDSYLVSITTSSGCKDTIQGTSFAAPTVAGIIALVLEANPNLTWRDIQHLIVVSSSRNSFTDTYAAWQTNGANREVSQVLGFGLLDASVMLNYATAPWQTVPAQINCAITVSGISGGVTTSTYDVNIATDNCPSYLEHVQAEITFTWSALRGVTEIVLVSPSGTSSQLMSYRNLDAVDNAGSGSLTWTFMSVQFWNENPSGTWTLQISAYQNLATVSFSHWKLTLYGTATDPLSGLTDPETETTTTQPSTATTSKEKETTTMPGMESTTMSSVLATTLKTSSTSKVTSTSNQMTSTPNQLTSTADEMTSTSNSNQMTSTANEMTSTTNSNQMTSTSNEITSSNSELTNRTEISTQRTKYVGPIVAGTLGGVLLITLVIVLYAVCVGKKGTIIEPTSK